MNGPAALPPSRLPSSFAAMAGAPRFPTEMIARLFEAILINDVVDAHTMLPDRIPLDHDPALLAEGFRLCRQLCADGVDRSELRLLLNRLRRRRDLDATDRLLFKHMRARLKHFRFACALFGADHRYSPLTDWFTTALGHLQDGFKNGQRGRVLHKALVADLFLSRPGWALLMREQDRLLPTDASGFRTYLVRQVAELAGLIAQPTVTGAQFHAGRKAASRQVAFYITAQTISPTLEYQRMARCLAAINGLMGAMHDDLVRDHIAGVRDYHRDRFALPADIGSRIADLVARYRISGLAI